MSELILKGTDLFIKKTGADNLHISGNTERMLFLIIGILLVFAGAAVAAAFFPLEGAILSSVAVGMCLLHETGVRYVVLLAVCGLLFQIVLFERKSERGRKIWKRFFVKKSNI